MNLKETSTFNEFKNEVEPVIMEMVSDIYSGIKEDVIEVGNTIAYQFAATMWLAKTEDGIDKEIALRNLEHLKVQLEQLKTIHHLRIRRAASEALTKAITAAFKFLLAVV